MIVIHFQQMDNDDEAMALLLMEEEAEIDAEEDECMAILGCLAKLQADEDANAEPKRGGSKPGRRKTKLRMRLEGHAMLFADYFDEVPRFDASDFRRGFRMSRRLFHKLVQNVREHDPWFKIKKDVVGMIGFSSLQKCIAAMRMLTYGAPADGQDDYLRMSESTAIDHNQLSIDLPSYQFTCVYRSLDLYYAVL